MTNLTGYKPSSGRHLLDGTVRVTLAEALIFPTGLVTTAFLTRWLGPSDYGLLVLAITLVGWIQWSIAAMFGRATNIYISQAQDWNGVGTTALRLYLVSGLLAAVILCLLADSIAALLGEPRLAGLLQIFAIDIPLFALAQAYRTILIGTGRYRQRAWSSTGKWLTRMVLVVVFVWAGLSVEGAILGIIGATMLELLIARYFVKPRLFGHTDFPASRLLLFAAPLYVLTACIQLIERMDIFALKLLGGTTADIGIYGAAQNLALVPIVFSLSFAPLLQSALVRLVKDKLVEEARVMSIESIRLCILLLPFAGMSAGASSEITGLIFGADFIRSGPVLAWLISGTVLYVLVTVNTAILIAAARMRLALLIVGLLVPLAVLGHLWLIPQFGPVGASMVTAGAFLAAAIASSIAVKATWKLAIPLATLARSLALAVLAFAAASWWSTTGLMLLIKLCLICAAIPLIFYIAGELTNRDLQFVKSSLNGKTSVGSDHHPKPHD